MLGDWGVGLLTLLETVFPPIPSEVVLPLAGFLAQQGRLSLPAVLLAATAGGVLGALLLYWFGARLGTQRAARLFDRLPLVDAEDVLRAEAWFLRHGRAAVFFGRLVPGVRSLISLPAGASGMRLPTFLLFTTAGTLVWNSLLVGAGVALGTQWRRVEAYAQYLDYAVIAVLVAVVPGWWCGASGRAARRLPTAEGLAGADDSAAAAADPVPDRRRERQPDRRRTRCRAASR